MAVTIKKYPEAPHVLAFRNNVKEASRLMEIHKIVAGSGPGRKKDVQVLNKSAIILLLACWEAYVEDLAENAFEFMLNASETPNIFPEHVLAIAGKKITKAGSLEVWNLAHDGWKDALLKHKEEILNKYIIKGSFNTPSAENIDRLFSELIGLTSVSREWYWHGMSNDKAKSKLKKLIELRGEIAHRVESSNPVYKKDVAEYRKHIARLGTILHNRTLALIYARTGIYAWRMYKHGKTS